MTKQFWAIIAIIVVIFGGVLLFHNNKNTGSGSSNTPTNHIEGSTSTGVMLVEYGDYECPFCGQYAPTVQQVVSQYMGQIQFQFRNLPLSRIHQNAFAAARAAEAAGLQNKFWQMHDLLYGGQSNWVNASNPLQIFQSYAGQLGLSSSQFNTDYASIKVDNLINADIAAFNKTGEEEATPTFFLDGKKVSPANNVAAFQTLINAEIAKKTGKTPAAASSSSASSSSTSNAPAQSVQ